MPDKKEPNLFRYLSVLIEYMGNNAYSKYYFIFVSLAWGMSFLSGQDYQRWLAEGAAVIGLISAIYGTWADERRKVISLQNEAVEQRRLFRDQIGVFLEEGKALQLRCMRESENVELLKLASDWGVRASAYLRSIELSYSAQFNAPERTHIPDTVWVNIQAYSYIDPRLGVLMSLLDRLM